MRLKICQVGEPALRQNARVLSREDILSGYLQELIEWMRETTRDAPGVGLAAPQVGLPIQLAVIEDRPEYIERIGSSHAAERQRNPVPFHVIINPKLRVEGTEIAEFFEGCLSLAGFGALVPRSLQVSVECLDHRGEAVSIRAEGWYARILQHEIDHLNGILYIDRMLPRSFSTQENYVRYGKGETSMLTEPRG